MPGKIPNPELSDTQSSALTNEIWNVGAFIREGLEVFPNLRTTDFFFDSPFLLLQQGFERFMKIILILCGLEQAGVVPKAMHTHDLNTLRNEVARRLLTLDSDSLVAAEWDRLDEDEVLLNLINIASLYGSGGRYHVLDQIYGADQVLSDDPEWRFNNFEVQMMQIHGVVFEKDRSEVFMRGKEEIYALMLASLQRFSRLLARTLVEGPLANRGAYLAPAIDHLLALRHG